MLWEALSSSPFATSSRDAVVTDQATLSYADLFASAAALARVLDDAGAGPGHVVLAYLDNTPGFLVALLAAARLGAAFAPLDIGVTDAEAHGLLALSQSDLVICDPASAARVATWSKNFVTVTPRGEVVEPHLTGLAPPSVDPGIGIMQFSSGTTAASKGILLGHEALFYRSHYLSRAIGLSESDRTLCTLPLSHTHGAECLALPSLMTGGTLFLKSPRFSFPLYILEELERLRITFFSAIPQFYDVAVKLSLPRTPDLSALRLPFCGSAALSRVTAETFNATFGVHIRQGYGLAELSVICVNMHEGGRVVYDAVGKVLDGIEARVTDDGELLVRSKAMFTAYINAEAATRERLRDGWLHTGDIVSVGDDGMYRIVGRKEDFIKVNGFKVYASEVETAIVAVDWVAECAVIGERDAVGSESIVAHLVVRDGAPAGAHEALVRQLRPVLSEHKLPRRTVVHAELPKNPLGKILKSQIRQTPARK
jgi:long-chain acyl-CoA synthetase